MIKKNLESVRSNIAQIAKESKIDTKDLTLVVVTKTIDAELIKETISYGITDIGENYVQEAKKKFKALGGYNIRWHFIGHLQLNKVKYAVKIFDLIQTLDRIQLAEELNKHARKINKIQDVLIQVNVSEDSTKFGVSPKGILELIANIKNLNNIRLIGLMAMAPFVKELEKVRPYFRLLKELRDKINESQILNYSLGVLSMGMSWDYRVALEEGSNMLRIGRAIFGER